jgi:hypothetical protein
MSKKDPELTLVPTAKEIDALYRLPLEQFTPERNALAKRAGKTDPAIKSLEKPNIAAWAVNQLYWRERETYEALIEASERLREEHRKLLAGKSADIRDSETAHRDAIRAAVEKIRTILGDGDQAATPATLTAVSETLSALPGEAPAGRLTRPLKPSGFEALTGVPARPASARPAPPAKSPPKLTAIDTAAARREEAAATRAAEAEAREAAREKERLQADARRAKAAYDKAQAAVEKAEEDVAELEKALTDARKTRDRLQVDATLAKNELAHAERLARN